MQMEKIVKDDRLPLFETKEAKCRSAHKLYFVTMLVGLCLILAYRWIHIQAASKESKFMRWAWYGMLGAELWFAFYWILTQAIRWRPVFRYTFKDRLLQRYGNELPHVDIFVCTADPVIEPPLMVINTVLSVMAYDYPTEKLSVYLSDDGGSELSFYALLEATQFAKHWIPFCKIYNVMPRCPAAYFSPTSQLQSVAKDAHHFAAIKELYKSMEERIETVIKLGRISEHIRATHKGFKEWDSKLSRNDHQTILEILIDGEDPISLDEESSRLPTVVYLAREKRPHIPHNFKAGAMNALIRVSSEISNGPIILNVDCDMYSNDPESVKDALCFFLDEEAGNEIAYVQFPQCFNNITKNDPYYNSYKPTFEVEFRGLDGFRGPMYLGTGCFHRRESLCGKIYNRDYRADWTRTFKRKKGESVRELEDRVKNLANCAFEQNTQWGNKIGLKYGCLVEDAITGLSIQCRGWRSVYLSPSWREAFLGVAPTTLLQTLVQHKRWGEGHLHLFFIHNPFLLGWRKIPLALQLGYSNYNMWAFNSLPLLYYVVVPSLCLLKGLSVFPKVSSPWFIPFGCVIVANYTYSLCESFLYGVTILGWWNFIRMTIWRRTSSYLFGIIGLVSKLLSISNSVFVVTAKTTEDEGVAKRYEQEIMEFGSSSPMFTLLATIAMINLLSLLGAFTRVAIGKENARFESLAMQFTLGGSLVMINFPIYEALFFRKDAGKLPLYVTLKSLAWLYWFVQFLSTE